MRLTATQVPKTLINCLLLPLLHAFKDARCSNIATSCYCMLLFSWRHIFHFYDRRISCEWARNHFHWTFHWNISVPLYKLSCISFPIASVKDRIWDSLSLVACFLKHDDWEMTVLKRRCLAVSDWRNNFLPLSSKLKPLLLLARQGWSFEGWTAISAQNKIFKM